MKMIAVSPRLKLAQHDKLVWLANQNNISTCKMIGLVIDSGLETLSNHAALEDNIAAYTYARAATDGGSQSDEQIRTNIQSAYVRQKQIARGIET